jgi:arsenite methyltransferase
MTDRLTTAGRGVARFSAVSRPRYGVDGWPYVVGLTVASAVLAVVAVSVPRPRVVAGVAALLPGVPAFLGLRYVVTGKLRLRDLVLDQLAWSGGEVVVDLGAGGGLLGLGATARTTGTVHLVDLFVGKDLSGNCTRRLDRNIAILGVQDRVRVHRRDVRATGLPDGCADAVLSSLCIHNLAEAPERADALDEAIRLLRPGGTLVISDLANVVGEYAPRLRAAGLQVDTSRAPATFPPQRIVVARKSR